MKSQLKILLFVACTATTFAFQKQRSDNTTLEFWQTGVVYQVYPRSLLDDSSDGIGDLKGISAKADYFKELGVDIIWISPIYKSPMKDFGYDISNYEEIDPIFGTMEDFDNLLKAMHLRGIKVVLDFVPNHSSDQHEWFVKSVQKDPVYKDFYIWKDPLGHNETGDPIPPNNWLSVFRYSAWEWSEQRQQFYYHAFLLEQPDLNYRNPAVVQAMHNVLRFWLNKGVDGFRIDAIIFLAEVEDVYGVDEPVATDSEETDPTQYDYLNHTYTINLPLTYEITRGFRKVIDEYPDKVTMVEAYTTIDKTMEYYGNDTDPIADFPFNFLLITEFQNRSDVTGKSLKAVVDTWFQNMPPGKWPNWVLGNHDNGRVASRLGKDLVDSLNMFNLLLPGTPVTYYGEEIGMENTYISYEDTQDPNGCAQGPDNYQKTSRDPERTPMQWDDSDFAGFTEGNTTWLPVNDNYVNLNVELQRAAVQSSFKVYTELTRLRKENTFLYGELVFQIATDDVVAYIRYLSNEPSYMLVINTSEGEQTVDATSGTTFPVPANGTVLIRSSTDSRTETAPGTMLDLSVISLLAGEGFVIQLDEPQ